MGLKAVFVDAAGTLLHLREPVGVTYTRAAAAAGLGRDPVEVGRRFREALRRRRGMEQVGDGRVYWAGVVAESLETDDPGVFEALYATYARPEAWGVDPAALELFAALGEAGVSRGVVSNWDTRLRGLWAGLGLDRVFPILVCSAEVGWSKPDPRIFLHACARAGCAPGEAAHVGDDPVADVAGAEAAGLQAILYTREGGWAAVAAALNEREGGSAAGR